MKCSFRGNAHLVHFPACCERLREAVLVSEVRAQHPGFFDGPMVGSRCHREASGVRGKALKILAISGSLTAVPINPALLRAVRRWAPATDTSCQNRRRTMEPAWTRYPATGRQTAADLQTHSNPDTPFFQPQSRGQWYPVWLDMI